MGSNATAATAATATGGASAALIVLVWVLGLFHVTLPADVGAAFIMLLGPALHGVWLRYVSDPVPTEPTAMVPVTVEAPPPMAAPAPAMEVAPIAVQSAPLAAPHPPNIIIPGT
jgi:hypothetical protein